MVSRRALVILAVSTAILVTGIVAAAYLLESGLKVQTSTRSSTLSSAQNLPAGCKEPAGGYLIVASINGFNDSASHGAPSSAWPIITVQKGESVKLVVCNIDSQAHGFQIGKYFDSNTEAVAPGQAITVSFVADKTGTFTMYCSIFCSVHIYMQSGELRVGS